MPVEEASYSTVSGDGRSQCNPFAPTVKETKAIFGSRRVAGRSFWLHQSSSAMFLESLGVAVQQAEQQRFQEIGTRNTVIEQMMQSLNKQRDRANHAERERDDLRRELQAERFLRQQHEEALVEKDAMIAKQRCVNEALYTQNAERAREVLAMKEQLERAGAELKELQAAEVRLNEIVSDFGQLIDDAVEDTLVVD